MTTKVWAIDEIKPVKFAHSAPVSSQQASCILCRKPLGQKHDSPAITIDVYNPRTKQKDKAKAHRNCARSQLGLR